MALKPSLASPGMLFLGSNILGTKSVTRFHRNRWTPPLRALQASAEVGAATPTRRWGTAVSGRPIGDVGRGPMGESGKGKTGLSDQTYLKQNLGGPP